MYHIYMHKNKINGKVYIGETCQELKNRWKSGKAYKTCTYFNQAIEKYGWDNFEHIILESGDWTLEEAFEKEQYYICLYESNNPDKGYNIKDGGYRSISPNALPAALEWMKEHPEFGIARAQDMLKWQAEHPEEALAFRRENVKKATAARKKPVICIETGVIYESATEAARQVGAQQGKICMVCRGQRNKAGGYHWKYYNEEEENEQNLSKDS